MKACVKKEDLNTLVTRDAYRAGIFYPKTDIDVDIARLHSKNSRDTDWCPSIKTYCLETLKKRVLSSTLLPGGTFHALYKVSFSPTEHVIARVNKFPHVNSSYEFILDEKIHTFLIARAIPVPEIVSLDLSRTIIPTDIEIMSYVPGNNLTHFCDQQTQYMNPELLYSVGHMVARIHTIPLDGFGPIALQSVVSHDNKPYGLHKTWQAYVLLRLNDHVNICQAQGAITPHEAKLIQKLFNNHEKLLYITHPVLLHGDLGNHNFMSLDGVTINGIIDWEDCMSGDPVFDIAFWGTFLRDHMLSDFLKGYASVKPLSIDFYTRYWLYYLRVALSKTVHRFVFGYKDYPGRSPASLRIQKALAFFRE